MNLAEAIQILDLPKKTNLREAKAAYRRLAKKYHPDINTQQSASNFLKIVAAYEFLKEYVACRKTRRSTSGRSQSATQSGGITRSQWGTAIGLAIVKGSRWRSRKTAYETEFKDFIAALDEAMEESFRILQAEGERFCERVVQAIIRRIRTYSQASEIRKRVHGDVNQILHREALHFLGRLFEGPRHVVKIYDQWLAEMRMLARWHSLPQTIEEYLASRSGLGITFGAFAIFVPASITIATFCPFPLFVGVGLLSLSIFASIWGGKGMYCHFALKRVRQNTTTFLSQVGLREINRTILPISGEHTREEQAGEGAFVGGMLGFLALGPIAGIAGALVGEFLGGMSGREFGKLQEEVAEDMVEVVAAVLEDFLEKIESHLLADRQHLIDQMRHNFVSNLRDEKLVYDL